MNIRLIIIFSIFFIALITVLLAFTNAQTTVRDQKRVWDITQIQAALKIYTDENGAYPATDPSGQPVGINKYLDRYPAAPTAGGTCTKSQNAYDYRQLAGGDDYNLSFCLAGNIGGLVGGIHM